MDDLEDAFGVPCREFVVGKCGFGFQALMNQSICSQ